MLIPLDREILKEREDEIKKIFEDTFSDVIENIFEYSIYGLTLKELGQLVLKKVKRRSPKFHIFKISKSGLSNKGYYVNFLVDNMEFSFKLSREIIEDMHIIFLDETKVTQKI